MYNEDDDYSRVFVLRCWKDEDSAIGLPFQWHCSVNEQHGGQYRFECTGLGRLVAHLRVELDRGAREGVLRRHALASEQ